MSLPILEAKPEDIDAADKRGKYTVCVVGCGQAGIEQAGLFAEAGFKVVCADADQAVVNGLAKGKAPFSRTEIESKMKNYVKTGRLTATSDIKKAVSQGDIVIVAVPAKVDSKRKADYSNIETLCKQIGSSLKPKSLVIITKRVGIGVIEGIIKETLENSSGFKAGSDLALAYSPFNTPRGQEPKTALVSRRIVAAADPRSLATASAVLETIGKGELKKTDNMKAAEVAALLDVQRRDINIAVMNELVVFCEKTGVDYPKVDELLGGNVDGFPSSFVLSDGDDQEEPYLLLAEAENINVKLWIPATARQINEQAVKHAVNLVKDGLRGCGKSLRRSRVAVLGLSQVPNMKSQPKRVVREIIQVLTARGVRVNLYDPYYAGDYVADIQPQPKKNVTEAVERVDCLVITSGHEQFRRLNLNRLKVMMKMPAAIVDLEGITEPDRVEKEGFIYRGLGRGVWTK